MEPFHNLGGEFPDAGNRMYLGPGVGKKVVCFRDRRLRVTGPRAGRGQKKVMYGGGGCKDYGRYFKCGNEE